MRKSTSTQRPIQPYRLQEVALRLHRTPGRSQLKATSPKHLAKVFAHLTLEPRESLWGLYISPAKEVIVYERMSTGGLCNTGAEPAEVTRTALLTGACIVILLHNHPGGNPEPSQADVQFTREMEEALRLFDIQLGDHIILGSAGRFYSFYEHHDLPTPAVIEETRRATRAIYAVTWTPADSPRKPVIDHVALTPRQAAGLQRKLTNYASSETLQQPAVVPMRCVPLSCKNLLRLYPLLRSAKNPLLPLEIKNGTCIRNTKPRR